MRKELQEIDLDGLAAATGGFGRPGGRPRDPGMGTASFTSQESRQPQVIGMMAVPHNASEFNTIALEHVGGGGGNGDGMGGGCHGGDQAVPNMGSDDGLMGMHEVDVTAPADQGGAGMVMHGAELTAPSQDAGHIEMQDAELTATNATTGSMVCGVMPDGDAATHAGLGGFSQGGHATEAPVQTDTQADPDGGIHTVGTQFESGTEQVDSAVASHSGMSHLASAAAHEILGPVADAQDAPPLSLAQQAQAAMHTDNDGTVDVQFGDVGVHADQHGAQVTLGNSELINLHF